MLELRVKLESEEDVDLLRLIADAYEKRLGTGEGGEHQETWNEGAFIQFWNGLSGGNWRGLKPHAKRALREISKSPDGYPAEELLSVLGISGPTLGGNLSSVGFGMNHFPDYEWPFGRHDGLYVMPHKVAQIIRDRGL